MSSIRHVAREAGVSIATVSRVINGHHSVKNDLRSKVLRAIDDCEYRPTVGKRTTGCIAMLYAGTFSVDSPYDSACLGGIVRAMRQTKYDLITLDLQRDRLSGESISQYFSRKGVGGAIVRSTLEQRTLLQEMAAEGLPLVVLGDHFDCPDLHFCYSDSRSASREAVEHLISLGHQSIAFAVCDRDDGDHLDRYEAYREVLEEAGLYREDLVHRVPPSRMDGVPVLRRIMSQTDRPTAVFIADPLVAVGALNEAHEMGVRVPEDLSIVAVDDTDVRSMVYPKLSAVCQDSQQIGEAAFQKVCQLIDGKNLDPNDSKSYEAWFEIHDTTGPAPAQVKRFLPGSRLSTR